MTYDDRRRVEIRAAAPYTDTQPAYVQETHRTAEVRPSAVDVLSRVVMLVFGLIQLVIVLRIVLLLLDARTANGIVQAILDLSRPLVTPFEGMLRTDALQASGAALDVSAVVALVGWTILELVVLAVIRVARRPAVDA